MLLAVKGSHTGLAYSSTGLILEHALYAAFLSLTGDLDVAPEEAQGLWGFVADIGDMGVPTEVSSDLNSNIFCLWFCAKGVITELVL